VCAADKQLVQLRMRDPIRKFPDRDALPAQWRQETVRLAADVEQAMRMDDGTDDGTDVGTHAGTNGGTNDGAGGADYGTNDQADDGTDGGRDTALEETEDRDDAGARDRISEGGAGTHTEDAEAGLVTGVTHSEPATGAQTGKQGNGPREGAGAGTGTDTSEVAAAGAAVGAATPALDIARDDTATAAPEPGPAAPEPGPATVVGGQSRSEVVATSGADTNAKPPAARVAVGGADAGGDLKPVEVLEEDDKRECRLEEHAEYHAPEVLAWGPHHIKVGCVRL
jgi:hypothetical protein